MEIIIESIIRWAVPVICAGILTYLVKLKNDNKAMKNGLLAIIRSQIVSKCEEYQRRCFLPEYARYCLEDLFKQYRSLGGNHGIEILVNQTFELPPMEKERK